MPSSAAYERLPDQGLIPRYCAERFGIDPAAFADHVFWRRVGARLIRIAHRDSLPPPGLDLGGIGLQVMRKPPPRGKPTSVFLQRFAATARRNTYALGPADAERYMSRQPVEVEPVDEMRGYCVVRGAEGVLGCGRIVGRTLHSEIPAAWVPGAGN